MACSTSHLVSWDSAGILKGLTTPAGNSSTSLTGQKLGMGGVDGQVLCEGHAGTLRGSRWTCGDASATALLICRVGA